MEIKFGFGVFLNALGEIFGVGTIEDAEKEEAAGENVPFDVMLEKFEELGREACHDVLQEEAMHWGEDAQIFSEKMAARQSEVARAMENESARRVMKRRKLLHDEGSFPELVH